MCIILTIEQFFSGSATWLLEIIQWPTVQTLSGLSISKNGIICGGKLINFKTDMLTQTTNYKLANTKWFRPMINIQLNHLLLIKCSHKFNYVRACSQLCTCWICFLLHHFFVINQNHTWCLSYLFSRVRNTQVSTCLNPTVTLYGSRLPSCSHQATQQDILP